MTAPVAPINLTAVIATSTHINLSWTDNSNNETSFAIWRSVNSAAATQVGTVNRTGTQITSTGGTAVTFTNTGLTAGNTYAYYVTAVNIVGPSSASNTATVSFTAPAAPTSLGVAAVIANVSNDTVTLTWVNPAGNNQTSYSIQRATNSTFTSGLNTTTATGTALTLNQTVGRSATLYYRIRAVNAVGVSAYTNATPLPIVTP
jgi:predicted phage tail protein